MWCEERDIEFDALGSWTVKEKRVARGAEPDECFIIGPSRKTRRSDLAIEVIWTSGSVDKLEIYRLLNMREVWIWRRGELTAHVLRCEMCERVNESLVLPGIDLRQLSGVLDQPSTSGAIRAYRDLLRRRKSGG